MGRDRPIPRWRCGRAGYAGGMAGGNRVLLVGFDPNAVPGVDAALAETAMAMGEKRLRAARFETTYCLVAPDEHAEDEIVTLLQADT